MLPLQPYTPTSLEGQAEVAGTVHFGGGALPPGPSGNPLPLEYPQGGVSPPYSHLMRLGLGQCGAG